MQNRTLKAFTIMEIVITMLLSSIVVIAGLRLFINYSRLVQYKNTQMECSQEVLRFYRAFSYDFNKSVVLKEGNAGVAFVKANNEGCAYQFEETFIVRNNAEESFSDTFHIRANEFSVVNDAESGLPSRIVLELNACGEVYPVSLSKQSSNLFLMNQGK